MSSWTSLTDTTKGFDSESEEWARGYVWPAVALLLQYIVCSLNVFKSICLQKYFMFSRWCWSGCNWGSASWLESIYFRHRCCHLFRYGDYSTPSIKQLKLTSNYNVYISKYFCEDERLVCENVTLALDYKFYWKGNSITRISVTHTVGTISLTSSGKYTVLNTSNS